MARYCRTKARGEYRILDNGVAEGQRVPPDFFVKTALACDADEIVLPDVMGDCDRTIRAGLNLVSYLQQGNHHFKLAGVVQGTGFSEWLKCLNAYAYLPEFADVRTIMFPRCMNTSRYDFSERVQFLSGMFESEWYQEQQEVRHTEVHCLGGCPWVREVVALSHLPIRSMDTSLPVVLGLDGIDIRKDVYVRRQEGFFDIDSNKVDTYLQEVISDNCRTFAEWAQAPIGSL